MGFTPERIASVNHPEGWSRRRQAPRPRGRDPPVRQEPQNLMKSGPEGQRGAETEDWRRGQASGPERLREEPFLHVEGQAVQRTRFDLTRGDPAGHRVEDTPLRPRLFLPSLCAFFLRKDFENVKGSIETNESVCENLVSKVSGPSRFPTFQDLRRSVHTRNSPARTFPSGPD